MGEYANHAREKMDAVADATGITNTRLIGYMTSLTAKFKGLGYDVSDATSLAARGLQLAADGAAFWDMSLEETTGHLNSFINGSYQGGEAIGLFANDTQMAAYAVEKGIIADTKAWSELDEATKQATRLEYAENMYKLSGATGQAAKESDAYLNVQGNLNEAWRQFKAVIGEPILNDLVIPAMSRLTEILPALGEKVKVVIGWVKELWGWYKEHQTLINALIVAIGTFVVTMNTMNIINTVIGWFGALKTAVTGLWATLSANPIGLIVSAVAALAAGLVYLATRSSESEQKIKANSAAVTAFGDAVSSATPNLVHATDMLSAYGRTMQELDSAITSAENAVTDIIKTALAEQRQLRDDEIAAIKDYNQKIKQLEQEKLDTYRQAMVVEQMKIANESGVITQEAAAQYVANIKQGLAEANAVSEQMYNTRLTDIYNFHKAQGTLDSEAYRTDVANAKKAYQDQLTENKQYLADSMALLTENAGKVTATEQDKWRKIKEYSNTGGKEWYEYITFWNRNVEDDYEDTLATIDLDTANAFLSMYSTTVKMGGNITEKDKQIARDMIAAFDNLPSDFEDSGKEALLGMVKGMENGLPELKNASDMSAQEIVNVLKRELQIASPSKVTTKIGEQTSEGVQTGLNNKKSAIGTAAKSIAENVYESLKSKNSQMAGIGSNMVTGLESGISSKNSWIGSKIATFASGLVDKFKKAFSIKSPSRVMRDQIGAMLPAGIGEGIEDNSETAIKPMEELKKSLIEFDDMNVAKSIKIDPLTVNPDNSTSSEIRFLGTYLERLITVVEEYLPETANKQIVLDSGQLVGAMAGGLDSKMGSMYRRRERGG